MGRKRRAEPEPEVEDVEEDEDDEGEGDDDAEEAAPADPNAEAIRALRADFDVERAERLRLEGELRASRREPAAAPRVEPEEVVEDSEIDEAIAAGGSRARAVIQKMARIEGNKIANQLRVQYTTEMGEMRTKVDGFGLPALAAHTASIEGGKLTHFKRYEKEITERLLKLPLETRTQPEAVQQVYALVAGEHLDEIVDERVAEALKKANGSPSAGPTNNRGRSQGDTHIPTATELWGEAEGRMVAQKGGEDQYAQKQGFADWGAMLRETGVLEVKGNA